MRRLSSLVLCAGLFLIFPLPNMSAGDKVEPGFTSLFNGKNLDGWKEVGGKKESLTGKSEAYMGRFKVVDGKLVYDPAVKGDKYIETDKEFAKDVTIKFDFKAGPQVQQRRLDPRHQIRHCSRQGQGEQECQGRRMVQSLR